MNSKTNVLFCSRCGITFLRRQREVAWWCVQAFNSLLGELSVIDIELTTRRPKSGSCSGTTTRGSLLLSR